MSKIKRFFQKVKAFSKRNAYALVVAFCVICVFSVITAVSVAELYKVDNPTKRQEQEDPNVEPTGGDDVIVFDSPVKDANISKEYAEDHVVEDKTSGAWKAHLGIDYAGPEGTKVLAVFDGTVESIDNSLMDGVVITIVHNDNIKTVYKSVTNAAVSVGDKVTKGQEIAEMGTSTSEKADGCHLHFEVLVNGNPADPNDYLSSKK